MTNVQYVESKAKDFKLGYISEEVFTDIAFEMAVTTNQASEQYEINRIYTEALGGNNG